MCIRDRAYGERQDGASVRPESLLVNVFRFVEKQRRDEQHEEQVGIKVDLDL